MDIAYIGLGSNLGDSLQILAEAWRALGRVSGVHLGLLSHPYRTEPVGMTSDNWFVNAAGQVRTALAPFELLDQLHKIERQFGRQRNPDQKGYQDRTLDMDILLYGHIIVAENDVRIPHPALQDRLFVLAPLCEIAPDVPHPVQGKNIKDLLKELKGSKQNPFVEMVEWDAVSKG